MTHNSALDASPPKASRLPEVILSSMDLLAENTQKIQIKLKHLRPWMSIKCAAFHAYAPAILLTLTGQAVPGFDRVLRDVIRRLFPVTQQKRQTPKWSRWATFMIVLLRFGSHGPCCCLEMSGGMHEMICWAVLFLVPGTTGTMKTAPCAVWNSCNILYVVYKQIPDTQLKEALTRFHFMPTAPFTCYTLGCGVWMLSLWFTAHKSAQVLSARTVWTRCIISHILVNTRPPV